MSCLVLWPYRWLRYTEEENKRYYDLQARHSKYHWRSLFAGAFPVFVAATISQAVVAIIEAITEDEISQIWLNLAYSFGVAQMLGYWVIYTTPSSAPSFRYYYRVVTENSAFAWKELLVLLFINQLIDQKGLGISAVVYIAVLIGVCLLIASSDSLHLHFFKAPQEVYLRIKLYESESFALGLAFILNIIVIAGLCGVNYLSFLHYTESDEDYYGSANACTAVGFIYPLTLGSFLVSLQTSGLLDKGEEFLEHAECCDEDDEEDEVARLSAAAAEAGAENASGALLSDSTNTGGSAVLGSDNFNDEQRSLEYAGTTASLSLLFYVYLGVFVGCAWYAWSVSIYGHEYTGALPVVGALIFATVITLLAHWHMIRSSMRIEGALKRGKITAKYGMRRGKVTQVAMRLVVGWSWEQVTVSAIDLIFEGKYRHSYTWAGAGIKVALALAVFFIGREVELRAGLLREQQLMELRASTPTGTGPGAYN